MSITTDIESALRQILPPGQHPAAAELARLLAATREGTLNPVQARARLGADPLLAEALRGVVGQQVAVNSKLISFEQAQIGGDVSIGDVSAGDIITVSVGTLLGHQTTIETLQNYTYITPGLASTPRSPQEQRDRRAMLTKVRSIWVEGLLERSLSAELRIDLDLRDAPDAVNIPLNAFVQELNLPPRELPAGVPISAIFDQMNGQLLILGEPGAGKTTLLLELLRDLIGRAERDEAHPIPVLFPLSTWAAERKPLQQWLVDQLNASYEVPRKVAMRWVEENEVLPLLDGLDEVALAHRDACVEAINQYRQDVAGLSPLAVASRVEDYQALKAKLRLRGAVRVERLSAAQVERYLERVGEPLRAVRDLVRADPDVMDLLNSPLMVSVASLAFRDASPESLRAGGTPEERRARLWDSYIARMFARNSGSTPYRPEQTTRRLAWLARQMVTHQETVFAVERLQYDWLAGRPARWAYVALDRFIACLLVGLFWSSLVFLNEYIVIGPAWPGLSSLVANALVTGLVACVFGGTNALEELQQRGILAKLGDVALGAVAGGLAGWVGGTLAERLFPGYLNPGAGYDGFYTGFLLGAPMGLLLGTPGLGARAVITVDHLGWSWRRLLSQLAGSLLIVLALILITAATAPWNRQDPWSYDSLRSGFLNALGYGLPIILLFGFYGGSVRETTRPNLRVHRSARNALIGGLATGLLFGLCFFLIVTLILTPYLSVSSGVLNRPSLTGLMVDLYGALVVAITFAGVGFLAFGWYAVQSHYILRWLLAREGALPLRDLIPWLDYCCERLFLRRIGGSYIFIHRTLRDHLAAQAPRTPAP